MTTTARRIKGLLAALGLTTVALAQQDPQFTQYMFNLLSINPAYAGSAERVSLKALTRHQWVGFEGAPTTQTLTGDLPLPMESLCVGASLMRDEIGPATQYAVLADVAYRIFMGNDAKLAFGLKGGLNLFQADLASLHPLQSGDQVFQENIETKTDPQFGFGVMYYSDRYFVGLSAPKLLHTQFFNETQLDTIGSPWQDGQRSHWFLSGGYLFDLGTYTKFRPTALVKGVHGAPVSFDITASFLFYEKFWIGAMYRQDDAVGALVQYHFTDGLSAGYSYDFPITPLQDYSGGSHEIMIGFEFGNKLKGIRSPRYF